MTDMQLTAKSSRKSNLELLRILCMLFIVAHHLAVHGKYGDMPMTDLNRFVIQVLASGGKLGVNIYVLISGYFLINSTFKLQKIINTLFLTVFYSAAIYLSFVLFAPDVAFSFPSFFDNVFVIYNNAYWFVTCYIAMVLLSPFINKLLHAIGRREHLILMAVLLLMQVKLPFIGSYFNFSDTVWFITLYVIAGYLRLYPIEILSKRRVVLPLAIVLCSAIALFKDLTTMKDIVGLGAAIMLFSLFNSFNLGSVRIINMVSRATFGIYLIHDNNLVREVLWSELFKCPMHAEYSSFWLFAVLSVIVVFVACAVIELVRITLTRSFASLIASRSKKRSDT